MPPALYLSLGPLFARPLATPTLVCHDVLSLMRWLFAPLDSEKVTRLARQLSLPPLVARLLVLRGLDKPEPAQGFLCPSLGQLHDPFLMADMTVAVERLRQAINRQEKILIYGDYDVDGTMAVVVLLTALRSLGASVEAFVPHRLIDGYGLRAAVLERAAHDGYRLAISVDTGVREHAAIAQAREHGIDCVVTDHHLPGAQLPPACAILNPRRSDCPYPDKNLSGVGVAFKLAQALLGTKLSERVVRSYLKIVAIGTIADVVPLVGENRVFAHFGLEGLSRPVQRGLEALLSVAGFNGDRVTAGDVGFRIAPRLNAAGRMENARDVIDLLTSPDASQAAATAERLELLNRERQRAEDEILSEITGLLERQPGLAERYSLVLAGERWHRGVIGIVAQRLVERTHRPTLVVSIEDGVGHGSGRSIPGMHLLNALNGASDLFERYGGHAQAAGFTLPAERISELERRFETQARAILTPGDLEPTVRVDAEVTLPEVDWNFYEDLRRLEPFGCGNPTPVFAVRNLQLLCPARLLQEKHLKLAVSDGRNSFEALAWRQGARMAELAPSQPLDLAFTLDKNVFQEVVSLRLVIRDFRCAAAA